MFNNSFDIVVLDGFKIVEYRLSHDLMYFLVDGMYLHWPIFARPITGSDNQMEKTYLLNK